MPDVDRSGRPSIGRGDQIDADPLDVLSACAALNRGFLGLRANPLDELLGLGVEPQG